MKAERTDFGEGMIIVSCIHPPIDGRDIVIEMHRNDKRVSFITASRKEVVGWIEDLRSFAEELNRERE
jgi:hypothetical protein